MKEIWKHVVGYEGYYIVSNFGNIRSIERNGTKKGGNILSLRTNKIGYKQCNIQKDGKTKTVLVHRIVAQAFIPNPLNKPNINHKDFDKTNNCVDNLEWVTQSENCLHSGKHISESKMGVKNGMYGKKAWNSGKKIVLTEEQRKKLTKNTLKRNPLAYIHFSNERYRLRIPFLKINKNFIKVEDALQYRKLVLEN